MTAPSGEARDEAASTWDEVSGAPDVGRGCGGSASPTVRVAPWRGVGSPGEFVLTTRALVGGTQETIVDWPLDTDPVPLDILARVISDRYLAVSSYRGRRDPQRPRRLTIRRWP